MPKSATRALIEASEASMQSNIADVSGSLRESIVNVSSDANTCISGVSLYHTKIRPRRLRQAGIPTPNLKELIVWSRVSGDNVYLVYNDPIIGVVKTELEN